MRIVAFYAEVVVGDVVKLSLLRVDPKFGEGSRRPLKLLAESIDMVQIDMGVAKDVDQVSRRQVANVCNQIGEERVGGDVERDAQAEIAAALEHLAGKLIVARNVELAKDVTWR